jgi:hypothetical protein
VRLSHISPISYLRWAWVARHHPPSAARTTSGTFSSWLDGAGIPARVIDELMGPPAEPARRAGWRQADRRRYRHTTADMAAWVVDAIEVRLAIVLRLAEEVIRADSK